MPADKTYTRIHFPPADECALGPVKVFGPDGALIRVLSVETLRQRPPATTHAAPIEPHRAHFFIPTAPRRKRPKGEERD